jgi:hypothetical protein
MGSYCRGWSGWYEVIILALLVISRFIGPLLLAFIITYLLHPVAVFISKRTRPPGAQPTHLYRSGGFTRHVHFNRLALFQQIST